MLQLVLMLVASVQLAGAASDEFRIVHLTDFHYDSLYRAQSSTTENCRTGTGTAGRFGDRNNCDTPLALVEATTAGLAGLFRNERGFSADSSFLYWSGDANAHRNRRGLEAVYDSMNTTIRVVLSAGFRPLSVIPAVGNHDEFPEDSLKENDPVFSALGAIYQSWGLMTASEVAVFSRGGYFSRELTTPGGKTILAISLNTILWFNDNPYALQGVEDAGQMAFLEAELARARAARIPAVHIICHAPPGYQSETGNQHLVPVFNNQFLSLLEDYQDVAKAVFAGHEHKDSTRVLANRLYTGFMGVIVFVTPSITANSKSPAPNNNPGVRLYRASLPGTFDIVQDFISLEAANALPLGEAPVFTRAYQASEAYGFEGQGTLSDWAALVRGMGATKAGNPAGAWLAYITNKYVSSQASPTECIKNKCIANNLCAMVCGRMDGRFEACVKDPAATISALALPNAPAPPSIGGGPDISRVPSVQPAPPAAATAPTATTTRKTPGGLVAAAVIALVGGLAGIAAIAYILIAEFKTRKVVPMEALPRLRPASGVNP